MASKRRIRRKSCGSKRRYESQQQAMDGMFGMKRRVGSDGFLRPYKCKFCGGFHFGHAPRGLQSRLNTPV